MAASLTLTPVYAVTPDGERVVSRAVAHLDVDPDARPRRRFATGPYDSPVAARARRRRLAAARQRADRQDMLEARRRR